jgi:hypothetical protein
MSQSYVYAEYSEPVRSIHVFFCTKFLQELHNGEAVPGDLWTRYVVQCSATDGGKWVQVKPPASKILVMKKFSQQKLAKFGIEVNLS